MARDKNNRIWLECQIDYVHTKNTHLQIRSRTTFTHYTRISCQRPKVVKTGSVTPLNGLCFIESIQWPVYQSLACWCFLFFFSFVRYFFFFVRLNDFWVGGLTFVPFSSNIRYMYIYIPCRSYACRGSCCTFCSCLEAHTLFLVNYY